MLSAFAVPHSRNQPCGMLLSNTKRLTKALPGYSLTHRTWQGSFQFVERPRRPQHLAGSLVQVPLGAVPDSSLVGVFWPQIRTRIGSSREVWPLRIADGGGSCEGVTVHALTAGAAVALISADGGGSCEGVTVHALTAGAAVALISADGGGGRCGASCIATCGSDTVWPSCLERIRCLVLSRVASRIASRRAFS